MREMKEGERIERKCDGTGRRRCMSGGKEKGGRGRGERERERERERKREREGRRFTQLKPSVLASLFTFCLYLCVSFVH